MTSATWVQLHELRYCNDIHIRGFTAIKALDAIIFASTVCQGCKLHLDRDWLEEEVDPNEAEVTTITEALPALFFHRQKTGRPLVEIVFD